MNLKSNEEIGLKWYFQNVVQLIIQSIDIYN